MTFLPECDFFVRMINLPPSIHGMTVTNDDSTFSVYINSKLSVEQQKEAYMHDVSHIVKDDFFTDLPIEEIENL